MRYVINALPGSALAGHTGDFRPASDEEAMGILRGGEWESAVGHESTAAALSLWAGVDVPCRRVSLVLRAGDELVVAALRGPRLAEGQVLSLEEVQDRGWEWLLVRIVA